MTLQDLQEHTARLIALTGKPKTLLSEEIGVSVSTIKKAAEGNFDGSIVDLVKILSYMDLELTLTSRTQIDPRLSGL